MTVSASESVAPELRLGATCPDSWLSDVVAAAILDLQFVGARLGKAAFRIACKAVLRRFGIEFGLAVSQVHQRSNIWSCTMIHPGDAFSFGIAQLPGAPYERAVPVGQYDLVVEI